MIKNQVRLTQFSDLITRYTVDFIGREWLEKQLEALLEKSDIRFVVLIGEPGIGKTAFMANLAAKHPGWPRYFLRRDSRELLRSGDAKTFLLTIGGQLASLYPQLFRPENLNVTVRQRIESLEQGGSAIGIRIDELKVSPFHNVALYVEQEIRRVKGEVTGLEIGRLVGDARLLDLADLESLALLTPAGMLRGIDPSGRIVILLDALDELSVDDGRVGEGDQRYVFDSLYDESRLRRHGCLRETSDRACRHGTWPSTCVKAGAAARSAADPWQFRRLAKQRGGACHRPRRAPYPSPERKRAGPKANGPPTKTPRWRLGL